MDPTTINFTHKGITIDVIRTCTNLMSLAVVTTDKVGSYLTRPAAAVCFCSILGVAMAWLRRCDVPKLNLPTPYLLQILMSSATFFAEFIAIF